MQIRPLDGPMGCEILDFDLLGPTSDADIAALRDAYDRYHMLLFRQGVRVPPDRHVEMTGWFGPPVDDLSEGRLWTTFTNATNAGKVGLGFHQDYSFTHCPVKGISLHSLALPAGGATTRFVSGTRAWARLPEAVRQRLSDLKVRHSYVPSVNPGDPKPPRQDAIHPLRLPLPRTGTPTAFINEFFRGEILDIDSQESDRLIRTIFDVMYAPDNLYVHHWRLHDLMIWDNRALQHARDETDVADGERTFQRVVLNELAYDQLMPDVVALQKQWREVKLAS